jgi:hypothetical protein
LRAVEASWAETWVCVCVGGGGVYRWQCHGACAVIVITAVHEAT